MKQFFKPISGVCIILFAAATISCNKNNAYNSGNPYPATTTKEIVMQSNGTLGNYLTDKNNRTIYFFSNDANGTNTCTGGCEPFWPIFNVTNLTADQLGDGLSLSDFTTITTASGKSQLTFKGWPLYQYAPVQNGTNVQEAPGQITGEGLFGVWFVAKNDYSIMLANNQLTGSNGINYKSDYSAGDGLTDYFTDGLGRTLYIFTHDSLNTNKFTKPDLSNNNVWPVYENELKSIPSILDKTKFGSIDIAGKKQLTYEGWPLYHFGQDATRGSNKGVGFATPGLWHVSVKDNPAPPHS
jgi:predicted lipoprotein with Yx(FWY)xxD motif